MLLMLRVSLPCLICQTTDPPDGLFAGGDPPQRHQDQFDRAALSHRAIRPGGHLLHGLSQHVRIRRKYTPPCPHLMYVYMIVYSMRRVVDMDMSIRKYTPKHTCV